MKRQPPTYKTFKGTESQYVALHTWVKKHRGKPQLCEDCGDTKAKMCWANKSGDYLKDLDDWKRLCFPCHFRFDRADGKKISKDECMKGHKLTPENTYIKPGKQVRECRICRRAQHAIDNHKDKK